MSINNNISSTIVKLDTEALITQADNIVKTCTGTNCNISTSTRLSITQNSSFLAQEQFEETIRFLSISRSSVLGRQIYEAYINLGAAVASVYNFQCGNNTVTSSTCVPNAISVITAQNELQSLLLTPITNNTKHVAVLTLISFLIFISISLFFLFLILGLFEYLIEVVVEERVERTLQVQPVQPAQVQPVQVQPIQQPSQEQPIPQPQPIQESIVATPASPFISDNA